MQESQNQKKSEPEQLVHSVIQEFFQQRDPFLRQVVKESRDRELQQSKHLILQILSADAEKLLQDPAFQPETGREDDRRLKAMLTNQHRQTLDALYKRAEFVTKGLQSLLEQWTYLDRHSVLQEKRKNDILMHLSCSGSLHDMYQIAGQIAQGGRTKIYRALHKPTGQWHALKVLEAKSRSALLPRFLLEGSVGKQELKPQEGEPLQEYRLAEIIDFGGFFDPERHTGTYFIALTLLEGGTLQQWIDDHPYRNQPDDQHLSLVKQMIASLRYLHAKDFIHCDVHPWNFFVTKDNEIKLLDFGLIESTRDASTLTVSLAASMTQSLGGPTYHAPEQIDSLYGKLTPKTDVYALGVTLFYMFTGQLPFGTQVSSEAFSIPIRSLPARPAEVCKVGMPGWLDALIVRCMEKDPENRPELNRLASTLDHCLKFTPSPDRFDPLVDTLSRAGFDEAPALQKKITHIRGEFLHTLNPEETRFVPMERLEQAEEDMVERVQERIAHYQQQLNSLLRTIEPWDPLFQVCPNLLCRKPYSRGQQRCSACGISWQMSCKEQFAACTKPNDGVKNSFFAEFCQDPGCKQPYIRHFKIEAAFNKTVQVALQQDRCGEAAILIKVLGEHLAKSVENILHQKYYEQCIDALLPRRQQEQQQILEHIRNDWRTWIEEARFGFGRLHPDVEKSVLRSSQELFQEGRYLDALLNLRKFPEPVQHKEVLVLRNQIHEMLTSPTLHDIATQLNTYERQRKDQEATLLQLVPNPPAFVSEGKGMEGWLQGIQGPLRQMTTGCEDVSRPLEKAATLQRDALGVLSNLDTPFHRTEKPVNEANATLSSVKQSLLDLKDASNKKQLEGVEAKLHHVQEHLNDSQRKLTETERTLTSMVEQLTGIRIKLSDGREELDSVLKSFARIDAYTDNVKNALTLLEQATTQAQLQWPKIRQEHTTLLHQLQTQLTQLDGVAYSSEWQKRLQEQQQNIKQQLQQDIRQLQELEEQYQQLSTKGTTLRQEWKATQQRYQEAKDRQQEIQQQLEEAQKTSHESHQKIDARITDVRGKLASIRHFQAEKDAWMEREQERRKKILRSAISFGSIGSLVGIVLGMLLGWWLFARNISFQKPGWIGAVLWGGAMGFVLLVAIVTVLGRKVFQQPWAVIAGGSLAGGGISLISLWMGHVWIGPAVGVILGGVIGWTFGGGAGAFWNVRRLEPWRTLEKALKTAKYGSLFGVFAGASWGAYVGHVHLLRPSSYTWGMLVLGCLSLLALFSTVLGYFYEGGAWSDLKTAMEVDD